MTAHKNDKAIALLSYLFLLGWMIALFLNNSNRSVLGSFHVRQSFGIMCVGALVFIIVGILNITILTIIAVLGVLVLWLLGFLSAIHGTTQPVPVVGTYFQKWFRGI